MTQELSLEPNEETVIHQGNNVIALHRTGDVEVRVAGARVEIHADGSVSAYTDKDVEAYTSGAVHLHALANDSAQSRNEPEPGDLMPDGTIFAGISPDTGKPMFTTPADSPLTYTFNEARKYAEKLDAHGHEDWHVPTKSELNMLWENRDKGALRGTFNVTGSLPAGWYWSSTENDYFAWDQRFSDGGQTCSNKNNVSSLRCVR